MKAYIQIVVDQDDVIGHATEDVETADYTPLAVKLREKLSRTNADRDPIFVARPHLPPLEEFTPFLEEIWASRILTNRGPIGSRFESALHKYLGVDHITLVSNATLGLEAALASLDATGREVITTPFSFIATSHAIVRAGMRPVFADVDPDTYNLDPAAVRTLVSERTAAILPVHCYGRACDVEAFDRLSTEFDIPVIYDAAHAFGVRYQGASLLRRGHMSVVSFHATKVFTTFEGGMIVAPTRGSKEQLDRMTNFGIEEADVTSVGFNAKLNEVSCGLGLATLPYVADAFERRGRISAAYREGLSMTPGVRILPEPSGQTHNYSYFPVEILEEYPLTRDELWMKLKKHRVFARRYFSPLIPDMKAMRAMAPESGWPDTPVARGLADRILCLPIFPDLELEQVHFITSVIDSG